MARERFRSWREKYWMLWMGMSRQYLSALYHRTRNRDHRLGAIRMLVAWTMRS